MKQSIPLIAALLAVAPLHAGVESQSAAAAPISALGPLPLATVAEPVASEVRFVALGRITFVHNKSELTPAAQAALAAAAVYLTLHRGASRLLIRGHADAMGSERINQELSDRRAAAVRDYLVAQGVRAELIHCVGHGAHAPVDENTSPTGRARNRHVEVFAVYPPPASVR